MPNLKQNLAMIYILFAALITSCSTYTPKPLLDSKPEQEYTANQGKINKIESINFNESLTVQQLAILTVVSNPDLKALRAKNGVASAQVFDAGLLPDPQFAPLYEIPMSSGQGVTPAYAFGLNWDIGSLITRSLKESAAISSQQQIHYDIAWQEQMMANQAELIATKVYFLKKQSELLSDELKQVKLSLEISRTHLQNHDIKADDFSIQQNNYLDLQDQLQTVERLLDKTKLQLNQILGLLPTAQIQIKYETSSHLPLLDINTLFATAKMKRLDLKALEAGYNNQEIQLHQAILGQYPHFNISIYPGQDNTSNQFLGTNVSFDIPLFNRNRGAIAIATATREQLYMEYQARLHNTRFDIAIIVKEINWAKRQEESLNEIMPSLIRTDESMSRQLKQSGITSSVYINEHTNILNKKLKQLSIQQDIAEQRIALQMTLGEYLDE